MRTRNFSKTISSAAKRNKPAPAIHQAIDSLLKLDIPAKGRIAHHIRMGRLQRALALCAAGQLALWQKAWRSSSATIFDQVRLLSQVEILLRNTIISKNSDSLRGSF